MHPTTPAISLRATRLQFAVERLEHDLSLARACVKHLISQGHIPTHVDAGEHDRPIVWVEPRHACVQLKRRGGFYFKTAGFAGGFRHRTWRAEVLGCWVQWIEITREV